MDLSVIIDPKSTCNEEQSVSSATERNHSFALWLVQ